MEFKKMDEIQKRILMEVADLHTVPEGAFNIRSDGQLAGRANSANIEITSKENGKGIDIRIKDGTKNESVHIPVIPNMMAFTASSSARIPRSAMWRSITARATAPARGSSIL